MSGECEKCGHHAVECQCRALPALPADLAGLEAQNEWLKTRLADLQLPVPDRGAADRERWLIDCGMPALEALAGRQVAVTHDAHPRSMIHAVGDEIHNLSCERQNDEDLAERLGGFATRLWQIASAAPPAPQAAEEPTYAAVNADRVEIHNAQTRIGGLEDIGYGPWLFEDDTYSPTPPASGKVEAEVVKPVAFIQPDVLAALMRDKHTTGTVCSGLLREPFGDPVPLYSEITVAAMQAEIERLTRTWEHQWLQERDLKLAARAELAKLRAKIEKITFDMPESYYRTQLRALLKGERRAG